MYTIGLLPTYHQTVRASEKAYRRLRDDILSWRLQPGTPLSEVELAARLGVSRTPLRAALARLALEGLLDTTRGRTGIVPSVDATSVAELFELREALEVHAARLAARRRDPEVFAALAEDFVRAPEVLAANGVDAYYEVVAGFDRAIDEAIGNPSMRGALDGVRTHLTRARRLAGDNPARLLRAADEHRLICEAIRDGDEALAASATSVHLRASLNEILATLAARAPLEGTS